VKQFIVSVDLGQMNDYTAISILEEMVDVTKKQTSADVRRDTATTIESKVYALRHLERPEKRTTYDVIVDKIVNLMNSPKLTNNAELVIDITGVGRPVYDMMIRAGLKPLPISITGGKEVSRDDQGGYHVPKRDLASSLQVAFASRRLKIAQGLPLAQVFMTEMQNFKVKISQSGNDTYEAWREKDHDDLVLSVAMGVWWCFYSRQLDKKSHPLKKKGKDVYDILRL